MPYEQLLSSANPKLLILLTDESKGSVRIINRLIDHLISVHCDGDIPKKCYYIAVIGYNHNVKELCSGWLKDLDVSPLLRYHMLNKKLSDGAGGFVEIECKSPIWVEATCNSCSFVHYAEAITLLKEIAEKWIDGNVIPPIVIDLSTNCYVKYAIDEIKYMKSIETEDGALLFLGCYRDTKNIPGHIFGSILKEWDNKFNNLWIMKNGYLNGCFIWDDIWEVFYAITCGVCLDRHRKNRI